jgi:peptidase M48-like protein
MRLRLWLVMALGLAFASPTSRAQQSDSTEQAPKTAEDVIGRVVRSETAMTARMRAFHPLVEVYIQRLAADDRLGTVPTRDEYFLGQLEWTESRGPRLQALSETRGSIRQSGSLLTRPFGIQYLPDGFAAMGVPDWRSLDTQRYEFQFVKREFLGEARALVFDVRPRGGIREGFTGRIWVEDRGYNIVRFNGINRTVDTTLSSFFRKKLSFHVDSWRLNVLPGLWLPAYVYCEETDLSDKATLPRVPMIKSQIRIWGYELKSLQQQEQQFTAIRIDEPTVRDDADPPAQLSPVLSQRRWEQEAEDNVIARLTKGGLLAPVGAVDKVLATVINNLEVTNNIAIEPEVRTRVLLTSPLETFTAGHTIVVSRGLVDTLPDEASLAMMLAHELSHIVLGHQLIDTKFAFADRLMVSDGDVLRTLRFKHLPSEETAADAKQIELLKNSPYKDKLSDAGLFLRAIGAHAKQLTNLIQPHMGEFVADNGQVLRMTELMEQAPQLAPERLDQIAALPLGARVAVDPWSGRVEFVRSAAVPLVSPREKVPFAVTPLMPYIRYIESPESSSVATVRGRDAKE